MTPPRIEPIELRTTVPVEPAVAFAMWTAGLGGWWPSEYTFNGESLTAIAIPPDPGARAIEAGRDEGELAWGTVLESEPPRHLRLSWEISPDRTLEPGPDAASELELRFDPADGSGTRLTLRHDGFERHGPEAPAYREALAADQGWPRILDLFTRAAANR